MSMPSEWKPPTSAVDQPDRLSPPQVASKNPQSTVGTAFTVTSSITAATLLILAEGVGVFITLLAEMTTDGCGSDGSCNFMALHTAMGCAIFGPLVIPGLVLGIYVIRKIKSSETKSTDSDHIAGILWLAVIGDLMLFLGVMMLLGMVDPSS